MRLVPCVIAGWFVAAVAVAQSGSMPQQQPGHGLPPGESSSLARCVIEEPPPPPPLETAPVPEPSTLLLVGTGLVGLALTARRRRRAD